LSFKAWHDIKKVDKNRPMKSVKTGGRKKGTPNKVTTQLKEFISDLLLSYSDNQMKQDMEQLTPKERVELFYKMSQYVIPKVKAIDQIEDNDEDKVKTLVFIGYKENEERKLREQKMKG
jgi:hypothetical protein